jgi:hypothetical protein
MNTESHPSTSQGNSSPIVTPLPRVAPASPMTIDSLVPKFVVRMQRGIAVGRPRPASYAALHATTLAETRLARIAISIFERRRGRSKQAAVDRRLPLQQVLQQQGWIVLSDQSDRELILGLVAKVRRRFDVQHARDAAEFAAFAQPGHVKIALAFRVEDAGTDSRILVDLRVEATDGRAARKVRSYWRFLGVGSHLTIRNTLRAIRHRAEG